MILSIHPKIIGKAQKVDVPDDRPYFVCQGQRINLGWGWENVETSWEEAFELITTDGYATSAELLDNHRDDASFVSRELLMVDIDSGMSIEELLNNNWYNEYGAGFYITPSYTDQSPRFRILFRLEQAETDIERLRKINRGLLALFDQADQACKDPTRIFYGTPNCTIKERRDNLLGNDFAEVLVKITEHIDAERVVNEPIDYPEISDERRRHIVELLRKTYVGQYPIWRNVGWGLKKGGFTLADFQYVTAGMMSKKTSQDAAIVWADGSSDGDVSMGSVIHLLKQHHGENCMLINNNNEDYGFTKFGKKYLKRKE